MTLNDISNVLAIQESLGFQNWNERQFELEINASFSYAIVFESAIRHELLGYALFHLLGADSELLSIAVAKDAQHKGIGKKLLENGISKLDFANGDCLFLAVREDNINARHFYEKTGFEPFGKRPHYYSDGENAILYKISNALPKKH